MGLPLVGTTGKMASMNIWFTERSYSFFAAPAFREAATAAEAVAARARHAATRADVPSPVEGVFCAEDVAGVVASVLAGAVLSPSTATSSASVCVSFSAPSASAVAGTPANSATASAQVTALLIVRLLPN